MTPVPPKAPKDTKKSNFDYEFGGPLGAFCTTLFLPLVILLLAHWSNVGFVDLSVFKSLSRNDNYESNEVLPIWQALYKSPVLCPSCSSNNDTKHLLYQCTAGLVAWFLFQALLERFLPCELVEGGPVKGDKNHRLTYRINAHLAFWVTLLVVLTGWPTLVELPSYGSSKDANTGGAATRMIQFTSAPLVILYTYYAELAFCSILLCFGLSLYLYVSSFLGKDRKILADGGNSGNTMYDFFMGRELNPRCLRGSFDWKVFCELRPGLIGWVLLDMACLKEQYDRLGYVTGSMMLLNVFHGMYVWDALYQERAILTTMDITTDGFGFMLVMGDLAWVPFTYSVQARYLVQHDPHLSAGALAAIVALHCLGYMIFRGANGQKDAFRRNSNDPAVKNLRFLQTKRGTKLLTSGWWGRARKINYTGDYIMGLTWCLVCGFDSIVPYYYAIYFMILLIHRSVRDDHMCQAKYGDDWNTYKKIVPYRFIPGVV